MSDGQAVPVRESAPAAERMTYIDMPTAEHPQRGDLIYSNRGDKRERTWIVLRSRHMKRARHPHRYELWMARWWELEPDERQRLARSAERRGGQRSFFFERYRRKPAPNRF